MGLSDLFPSSSVRCYFCLFHHIHGQTWDGSSPHEGGQGGQGAQGQEQALFGVYMGEMLRVAVGAMFRPG